MTSAEKIAALLESEAADNLPGPVKLLLPAIKPWLPLDDPDELDQMLAFAAAKCLELLSDDGEMIYEVRAELAALVEPEPVDAELVSEEDDPDGA